MRGRFCEARESPDGLAFAGRAPNRLTAEATENAEQPGDEELFVTDCVNDPVITGTNSVEVILTRQFPSSAWPRI